MHFEIKKNDGGRWHWNWNLYHEGRVDWHGTASRLPRQGYLRRGHHADPWLPRS